MGIDTSTSSRTSRQAIIHYVLLTAAILFAYYKIFNAGFISWDDPEYVLLNKDIRSFSFLPNWFSQFYIGHYNPLTIASYAIDFLIGGQQPFIYHLENILLHVANALLLYAFINKLFANRNIALFVALLFALHPMHTESVSWVAERKTVLYGLFFFLSLLLYTDYVKTGARNKLVLVYITVIAAMLSKAAALSLPLTLFAVDIWLARPLNNRKPWLEKLPLLLVAIPFGILAINAQKAYGFIGLHPDFKFYETIVFAGYSFVQYIVQFLVPLKLSVIYPYPKEITALHFFYALLSVLIIILGLVSYRKKWNVLAGGILFYTVNIVLVLQFVQFSEEIMSDRYIYTACVGLLVPLVYYSFKFLQKKMVIAVFSVWAVLLLVKTYQRNDIWLSELNFWNAIVETFPESSVAESSLGGVYMQTGDYKEAAKYIDAALQADPNNYKAWYNKGVLLFRINDANNALAALNKCISINEYPKALFTRALLYQQTGQYANAFTDIEKVLQSEPENARAYYIKANCLEQQNNLQSAMDNYNKAIEFGENEPLFYMRRGIVAAESGQTKLALNDLNTAIQINPSIGAAWYWRGIVKYNLKQQPCADLNEALKRGYKEAEAAMAKMCH
jgi:tetratricopeptide (TPR) repeat protein